MLPYSLGFFEVHRVANHPIKNHRAIMLKSQNFNREWRSVGHYSNMRTKIAQFKPLVPDRIQTRNAFPSGNFRWQPFAGHPLPTSVSWLSAAACVFPPDPRVQPRPFFNSIVRVGAGRIVQIPQRTRPGSKKRVQSLSYELVSDPAYDTRLETEFDR